MPRLIQSSDDVRAMLPAVDARWKDLAGTYQRMGLSLLIPPGMERAVSLYTQALLRHEQGDFRHSDSEWQATKEVAQWLLDVKCDICGQPRKKLVELAE